MYQFKLPDLGEGIAEAEMVEWHVKEGDMVQENQLIGEVMTDKAVMEIPSPKSGRVHRLCAVEGDVIPVGHVLIEIDEGDVHEATDDEPPSRRPHAPRTEVDAEPAEIARDETTESWKDTEEVVPKPHAAVTETPVGEESFPRSEIFTSPSGGASNAAHPNELPSSVPASLKPPAASEALGSLPHPDKPGLRSMPPRPQAHPVTTTPETRNRADAVPAVREFAKELGVDIQQTVGTGPDGRVMRRDVEAFYEAMKRGESVPRTTHVSSEGSSSPETIDKRRAFRRVSPEPSQSGNESKQKDEPDWTRQPLRPLRRRIAERMVRSKTIIPHYTYVQEVDMTVLEEKRQTFEETINGKKISPLAFIAHAVVRVLADYPQMNASIDEQTGEIIYKGKIHLGIAVSTEAGLVVPVVRDATGRGVAELAAEISSLADRARKKRLNVSELKGSTITMTSLGKLGGVMATPIINYPESTIIGVHAIRTLPRYVDDSVEPRQIMNLSVSLDHRSVDGFECARFMSEVKDILETADFPEFK